MSEIKRETVETLLRFVGERCGWCCGPGGEWWLSTDGKTLVDTATDAHIRELLGAAKARLAEMEAKAEGIHDPSYRKGQHDTLEWLREKLGEPNLPTLTACGKRIADLRARLAEVEAERDRARKASGHIAEGWCREAAELEAKADALAAENRRLLEIVDRLPKTADGVSVIPGIDRIYHPGEWPYVKISECYSTAAAAAPHWRARNGPDASAPDWLGDLLAPAAVEQDGAREGQEQP